MSLLPRALPWALVALGCGGPAPGPCLRWANAGQTYKVTLGTSDPIPLDNTTTMPVRSCGTGVDLAKGDTFSLQTIEPDSPAPTCDRLRATTSSTLGSVTLGDSGSVGINAIDPGMEAGYPHVVVGTNCQGLYRLGLNETDGILRAYRYFKTTTPSECAMVGMNVDAETPWCWDSWLVEVRDSKDQVVATSID